VRPVVSLRLYSRNWGPANICDTLNAHRAIEGGYLRNTASVKCTTAIKKGRDKFGDAWAEQLRPVFAKADDLKATDLMQLSDEERQVATDFLIRDLDIQLKMHPKEGVDGGIFTRCVKWCVERGAAYTLGDVHELAWALRRGEEPVMPVSPVMSFVAEEKKEKMEEVKQEDMAKEHIVHDNNDNDDNDTIPPNAMNTTPDTQLV
jgi:hypothetical protein